MEFLGGGVHRDIWGMGFIMFYLFIFGGWGCCKVLFYFLCYFIDYIIIDVYNI